jgi:hypothetical protein
MGIYTIKQQITKPANFTGVAPDGVLTEANGVQTYAFGTVAGLFTFPNEDGPYDIIQVLIKFGGQTNWSLTVEDGAYSFIWLNGTTDNQLITQAIQMVTIPPGAKIKLVTTGTISADMEAAIMFSPSLLGNT